MMAGERRWSDRTARPSGCVVVLLAGAVSLLAGIVMWGASQAQPPEARPAAVTTTIPRAVP